MTYRQKKIQQVPVEETYHLRQAILRPGLSIARCRLPNDLKPGARHYAAYWKQNQVGVVSVYPLALENKAQAWQLRAMATVPWVRQQGYGRALLQTAEKDIRQLHGEVIWCHARLSAVGFYERSGFEVEGCSFMIPRVGEHYLMIKPL